MSIHESTRDTADHTPAVDAAGTPTGAPSPQVWPTLQARDARALVAFLTAVGGFGAAAVRAVANAGGRDGFNAVWASPENLPTAREIADARAWVRRVHG